MNPTLTLIRRPRSRRQRAVMVRRSAHPHAKVVRRLFAIELACLLASVSSAATAQDRTDPTPPARTPPSYGSSVAPPEPAPTPPPEESRRPWFGGLGYVSIAPFFGHVSGLESGLRDPTVLGESYGVAQGALLLGGGGGAVLFGHLWLGGHGYGLMTPRFHNARGDAWLTGGGGAFELGYVLSTSSKMLVIPYFALGGFAYNLEVTNGTTQQMPLLNAFVVSPGESKTFTAGFATLEVALRLQRLLFSRNGGMSAGFEVGLLRSLSNGPWLSGRNEFTHEEGALLDGVFARLNVGGGGFVFR